MKKKYSFSILFLFIICTAFGQNITGKIIDSNTGEIISYANIGINEKENSISNEEGYFTLSENGIDDKTSLTISCIGYVVQKITVEDLKKMQNIVKLAPSIFELNEVNVSNQKLSPYDIMANVKANFKTNYPYSSKPKKDLIFFRESNNFKPKILDVEIDKSTGFSKDALKSANAQMASFTSKLKTNPPKHFIDFICNKYSHVTKKDGKNLYISKMEVMKATKLKDANNAVALDDLEKSTTDIVLKHLDSTKYYRVKSGLFGSRDTITLRKDYNQKKSKSPKAQLTAAKSKLDVFTYSNSISNTSKFDFIHTPENYVYKFEGASFSDQEELIYELSFKPKKSKAKYKGTLYISESDFAVIRADYKLEEGKKLNSLNLKLLLGVKSSENISNGTVIYKKNTIDKGYILHYAAQESGRYFYVNRPLKFIELTSGEKDIFDLDLKVEGNSFEKQEYLNINHSESDALAIENIKEKDFNYLQIKKYDPKVWKDYSAIEPTEEMKQFKSVD